MNWVGRQGASRKAPPAGQTNETRQGVHFDGGRDGTVTEGRGGWLLDGRYSASDASSFVGYSEGGNLAWLLFPKVLHLFFGLLRQRTS